MNSKDEQDRDRALSPGWRCQPRWKRTQGGCREYKLDKEEVKATRCHLFTLCWLKCKVTHFLLEVPPPSQHCAYMAALHRPVHRRLCILKRPCTHTASTSSHLSDKLGRASHSVHLSFQLLGMHRAPAQSVAHAHRAPSPACSLQEPALHSQ